MSAVDRLESLLRSLEALKPPGASGAKIQEITSLCIENIQFEAQFIRKIYAQILHAPATHKLGVLYVVDSVTRQWIVKAGQAGQQLLGNAAPMGTYAAGVYKMTEALPHMIDELLLSYPESQKDKLKKLLDIWANANTFPKRMIAEFRHKMESPEVRSRTPPGYPPANLLVALGLTSQPPPSLPVATSASAAAPTPAPAPAPAPATADSNSILAALASLSKPLAPLPPANNVQQPQLHFGNLVGPQFGQQVANPPPAIVAPPLPFLAQPAAPLAAAMSSTMPVAPQFGLNGNPANPVVQPPQGAPNAPVSGEIVMQLLQMMAQGQLTTEQSIQVMSLLGLAPPPAAPPVPPAPPAQPVPVAIPTAPTGPASSFQNQMHDQSRQNGSNAHPDRRNRERTRSRSPDFQRGHVTPPNRRDSPTYGAYDPSVGADGNTGGRQGEPEKRGGRGRGRRDFRQRTPPPAQRKPAEASNGTRNVHKNFEFDFSIPKGHIKVLSRTLFVGGVLGSEDELRAIFSRFGSVQTCTVNREKRHAFVKMHTRKDAVAAHAGMQTLQNEPEIQSKFRQTRWGVGFGPREYHNYDNGVSVIPIKLLTDADRKWVVTAEYGGTGGEPIQEHLVIEEPDIEIGAGVSSKALSRRIVPGSNNNTNNNSHNHSEPSGSRNRGNNSNNNSNSGSGGGGGGRGGQSRAARRRERHEKRFSPAVRPDPPALPEPATIVAPPPVPGFGFQLPGMR